MHSIFLRSITSKINNVNHLSFASVPFFASRIGLSCLLPSSHKQQNGHIETYCSLVRILLVSIAEQHDCVHEPGAALWLKA
jgi:hypothetical protein